MGSIKAEKFEAMKSYKKKHFLYNLILHFLAAITCSLLCSYPYWFPSLSSSMKHFFLISLPYIWSSFSNPKFLFVVVNVIVIFLVGESRLASSSSSPADEIYNEYVERTRSLRRVSSACKKRKEEKVEEKKEVIIKQVNKVEKKEVEEEKESQENVEIVEDEEKEGDHGEEKESQEKVEIVEEDGEKEGGHGEEGESREKVEIVEEDEEKEGDGEGEAGLPPAVVRGVKDIEEETYGGGEEEGGLPAEELNKRVEAFIARVNKQRWLEANSLVLYCEA